MVYRVEGQTFRARQVGRRPRDGPVAGIPRKLADGEITADLPEGSPLVVSLTATDGRGAVVRAEDGELPGGEG